MKLFFDFLPIFLFFITYKFYGIYAATVAAMVTSLAQVSYYRIKYKRFESTQIITLFSILILGSATLLLHNEIFIKWKPTIIYWLLAILFLGSSFFTKKPLIQKLMDSTVHLPQMVWKRLNLSWAIFFTFLGCANLFVVYHYNTNTWVNFKLFGPLILTLVFVIIQSVYMAKHISAKIEPK